MGYGNIKMIQDIISNCTNCSELVLLIICPTLRSVIKTTQWTTQGLEDQVNQVNRIVDGAMFVTYSYKHNTNSAKDSFDMNWIKFIS